MKSIFNKPIKYLSFGLKSKSGVNNLGRKTVKTKSKGKSKRKFRILDFYRDYQESFLVLKIEYDPNRSASIALICFKNGLLCYIIATTNLIKGMFLDNQNLLGGTTRPLSGYSYGDYVSNIELNFGYGSKIARAAGTYCIILHKLNNYSLVVRFPSGEEKILFNRNKGTFGIVSNINHKFINLKKAGTSFLKGRKPIVRGVAKNCVDHPHGGGRGRTSKLPVPSNFTRRVLKGVPTNKKPIKFLYKSRKKNA
uniref:Ribosomal protein L2 n=1 Tax=Paramoeba aparasomata TaxID=2583407 RepID=A0A5P8HCE8_9EUKA|nr:ribosomal protein L2 [Paramoeba aparasomata]